MPNNSLHKRYFIKLFANLFNALVNAVMIALVPKALGPIAYGNFVYLQDFFQKAIGFLEMGSSLAFFTKLSARNEQKELIAFYFVYAIALALVLALALAGIQAFGFREFFFADIKPVYIYLGAVFGFLFWLQQIFIKISDAYALTVSVELLKILHRIAALIVLVVFVLSQTFDLLRYFLFHYVALGSFLVMIGYFFYKRGIFVGVDFKTLQKRFRNIAKEFIDYCRPLFIYNVVTLAGGFFDIWLLQKVAGSAQTGFYGLSYSFAAMCFLFTGAMTPVITREFAKYFRQNDHETLRRLYMRYVPMLFSLAAYFGVFVAFESSSVLAIFTDENFYAAASVVSIMAFYPLHQTFGQLSGSLLYATGQTTTVRNIALVTQPIGFLASVLLIYVFDLGALGLGIKMVVTQLIAVTIQLYYNARFLKLRMSAFIKHQIVATLFFVAMAFFASLYRGDSVLGSFLVSGVLYTLFVIIGAYIFPYIFALKKEEIIKALDVVKRKITK